MEDLANAIEKAEALCRERGVQFTEQRRAAYAALQSAGKPIGAYELLALLEEKLDRKLAPLTVYRTLDFLVDQGLVHKINYSHTFAVCDHPEHSHHSVHLVCSDCGAGQEVSSTAIEAALGQLAGQRGFTVERQMIELEGRCRECSAEPPVG